MLQKVCFNTGTSTQILNSQSLVTTLGNRVLVAFSGNVRKQNLPATREDLLRQSAVEITVVPGMFCEIILSADR